MDKTAVLQATLQSLDDLGKVAGVNFLQYINGEELKELVIESKDFFEYSNKSYDYIKSALPKGVFDKLLETMKSEHSKLYGIKEKSVAACVTKAHFNIMISIPGDHYTFTFVCGNDGKPFEFSNLDDAMEAAKQYKKAASKVKIVAGVIDVK